MEGALGTRIKRPGRYAARIRDQKRRIPVQLKGETPQVSSPLPPSLTIVIDSGQVRPIGPGVRDKMQGEAL